jgi:signal transduction histidine kinase
LLRLKTLHKVQGPSVISFERVGRSESVDNFRGVNQKITNLINTIHQKTDSIGKLELLIIAGRRHLQFQSSSDTLNKTIENIKFYNNLYSNMFDSIVYAKATYVPAKKKKIWHDVLNDADKNLSSIIDSAEIFIDNQTNMRIKEIENRVNNTTKITIYLIAGITVFSLLFGLFFSRQITKSLRRLKESAGTIGKGNFNTDPSGYPNDETGDLATAFFEMSIDLKNAQEELIKSKRLAAIGEVVASVNHEINNPLMIISGNAQFLEMSLEGYPDEIKERVRTIIEETDRISRVTKKLREIKNPVIEDYTSSGEQMINLDKSST